VATQTLTFLFADIEGSTAMVQRLGDAGAGVLADLRRLLRAGLAVHGSEEVATQGDGVQLVVRRSGRSGSARRLAGARSSASRAAARPTSRAVSS
jgi:class 3 adenylate cyclase